MLIDDTGLFLQFVHAVDPGGLRFDGLRNLFHIFNISLGQVLDILFVGAGLFGELAEVADRCFELRKFCEAIDVPDVSDLGDEIPRVNIRWSVSGDLEVRDFNYFGIEIQRVYFCCELIQWFLVFGRQVE